MSHDYYPSNYHENIADTSTNSMLLGIDTELLNFEIELNNRLDEEIEDEKIRTEYENKFVNIEQKITTIDKKMDKQHEEVVTLIKNLDLNKNQTSGGKGGKVGKVGLFTLQF